MEHYKEGQYDDDLTVGIDEYDEDFDTGGVDLFDYVGDDESPLARLKSLVLSIDWEITDDILRQFNEELQDLKDIWHGNKVNLIYVQALEKISRYIYKEKSSAHPNAIKMLLTFYANLEKIVSDEVMSGQEKKEILLEDISRFERLKKQIAPPAAKTEQSEPAIGAPAEPEQPQVSESPVKEAAEDVLPESPAIQESPAVEEAEETDIKLGEPGQADPLLNLKAIVYGIDWEITERDLKNLSREVKKLEDEFKGSKAKLIFLQGIGSLGSYINLKRSDSHADAFKLLHSFFSGLETVVRRNLSGQAEKDILLPQVEKFNAFKAAVADTLSPEAIAKSTASDDEVSDGYGDSEIQPAFADVPDDVRGFKEEDEVAAIKAKEEEEAVDLYFDEDAEEEPEVPDEQLASEMESRLSGMFEEPDESAAKDLAADVALQGVDVESDADDESDEEPLPELDGELAPALASEEVIPEDEESPAVLTDKVDEFFAEPEADDDHMLGEAVPGVDVEHEADDDSGEEPLPYEDGEFAPALSAGGDFGDDDELTVVDAADEETEIDGNLDDFFGPDEEKELFADADAVEEEEESDFMVEEESEEPAKTTIGSEADVEDRLSDFFGDEDADIEIDDTETALQGIEVEHEADDDSDEEPLPFEGDELAPALSSEEDETLEDPGEAEKADVSSEVDDSFDMLFDDEEDESPADSFEDIADEAAALAGESDEALFQAEEDEIVADIASRAEDLGLEDREEEVSSDEALLGVDVETEDDDDSGEEPLPYEDGELAPALGRDDVIEFESEAATEEEAEVEDSFDALFEDEELEESFEADEELEMGVSGDKDDEFEALFTDAEKQEEDVPALEESALEEFEEAGFEEIADDDIDDIPEDDIPLIADDAADAADAEEEEADSAESDELLAMLADDAEAPAAPAGGDTTYDDDSEIPELSADELEAVLLDGADVTAAGHIPAGYPSADELMSEFGAVAGDEDEITHPEGNEDFIIGVEGADRNEFEEEEVVFEAVEDTEEAEEVPPEEFIEEERIAFSDDFDDDQTFGTTILSEEKQDKKAVESDQELQAAASDRDERLLAAELEDTIESIKAEDSSAYISPEIDEATEDSLAGMRSCISSLGLEIDDNILSALTEEIDNLRHAWLNNPAERTFIQLLSTITEHIDKYRYEADPQANKLLLSVFEKLELCTLGQIEPAQIQESLLAETSKVLQWQQRLIDRAPTDDLDIDAAAPKDEKTGDKGDTRDIGAALDDMSKQVDAIGNDLLMEKVSSLMKSELEQLKKSFKSELQELKEEILRRKG